jgi:molybdopterin molybdotransferase
VKVYRKPRVTVIATGDEIVAPGKPVGEGKVAASNIATIAAWCTHFCMDSRTVVVPDSEKEISAAIKRQIEESDCVITSGGAWSSERDLVIKVLDKLGWKRMFYRVKIGPGKAVGFGMLQGKPVFCLPGGPPSNQMAFLQLTLPGLRCLGGHKPQVLPVVPAVLVESVEGQIDWTQFKMGMLKQVDGALRFQPTPLPSRLQMLSSADGIMTIPEGVEEISAGSAVSVQVMGLPCRVLS